MSCALQVFGVRHHGPGSARSLKRALESYEPDCVLVEGPPDADDLLPLAAHEQMKPPVAVLVYVPDEPHKAAFYPFAVFSPEWIAIRYALARDVTVAFMDLPQANRLGVMDDSAIPSHDTETDRLRADPLGQLSEVAGFSDSERWWDYLVESRRGGHAKVFDAIADAMTALREHAEPADLEQLEARREASMRKTIRKTLRSGCSRLAVICGAWHAPVLREPHRKGLAGEDNAILKNLPKSKTAAAWVPWSYDRLSFRSGYGAGVQSPAYYHLLWSHDRDPVIHWMTRVARLMRRQDLDASSAHVIEAVRLADTLAALRDRPLPGLEELDEAARAVMCFGNDAPMRLIAQKLIVGDRLGRVPDEAPLIPLQQDLERQRKRVRMPIRADEKEYDLDLRKPMDLQRSHLLHRMNLLEVPWGERREQHGKKGTFHEWWRVQWHPEFVVKLIDAGRCGNTIENAATHRTIERVSHAESLQGLTAVMDDALQADLPAAVTVLIDAIRNRAAECGDVAQLMGILPSLARVTRYGNVRQTDAEMVGDVCDGLVARICIGLMPACMSLNDEAAEGILKAIVAVNDAVELMQKAEHRDAWHSALTQLADSDELHGLMTGRAVRILQDTGQWEPVRVADRLSLALSTANEPSQAAAWIEGFLTGSGLLLVHDEALWTLIDDWVCRLNEDHFKIVLPLLRRTFSTFTLPERRQMGMRAARGARSPDRSELGEDFNAERASLVLPVLAGIFGVEDPR